MLIYYFGESNNDAEIPSNERELDVKLFQKPISIKTRSVKGNSYSGVKLSWTVDAASAYAFAANYTPQYDIILDPFMGSGTTAIAAIKDSRHYVGYDISQEYIELANRRINNYLGQLEIPI